MSPPHPAGAEDGASAAVDRLLERLDGEARRLGIDSPEQAWIAEKLRQTAGHPLWSLRREDDKKHSGPPGAV
jgi:hypothetical protein